MKKIRQLFKNTTAAHACAIRLPNCRRFVTGTILAATLTAQLALTGMMNIRCEAVIIDSGESRRVLTAFDKADDILSEQRVALHPLDKAELTEENGVKQLTVIRAPEITLNIDSAQHTVRAIKGETVGDLLNREGISLSEYDFVQPAALSIIDEDTEIIYEKAFPVTITADGETLVTMAAHLTVGELLSREGVILNEYDRVNYNLLETVSNGMEISIDRVEHIETASSEPIPYQTEYRESTLYKMGTQFTQVEGAIGERITTTTQVLVNGIPEEKYISDVTIVPPTNEIILTGTALNEPYSKKEGDFRLVDGLPEKYAYCLSGKVTAYTAPDGAGTYSGRKLEIGTIGVDPDVIPFGSEVYICSKDGSMVYGYAIAADTGDLTDVIADVFMGTTSENYGDACRWGAQDAYVFVLSVGDNSISWK